MRCRAVRSSASRSRPRSPASRRVVVLDEPTTGLDVVTQARVLAEIRRIRDELGVALVYVSHDLAVVGRDRRRDRRPLRRPDRRARARERHRARPRHPYTRGLVDSIPDPTMPRRARLDAGESRRPWESGRAAARSRRAATRPYLPARSPCPSWSTRGRRLDRALPRARAHPAAGGGHADLGVRDAERGSSGAVRRPAARHIWHRPQSHDRRGGSQPGDRARCLPGAGGRVGLGQDNCGALHRRPASPDGRLDQPRRQCPCGARAGSLTQRAPARCS